MRRLLFVSGFAATLLLYWPLLNRSFTQDDFFLLWQARFNSPVEQVRSALPRPDSIYFRPLGMQGYFYIAYRLFGLHAWMYRVTTIVMHSLNAVLIYSLSSLLFSSAFLSISVSLLYLLSPLNFASLLWPANTSFELGMTLFLLLVREMMKKKHSVFLSAAIFSTGLLVNELTMTAPLLLVLLGISFPSVLSLQKKRRTLLTLGFIAALYASFRLVMPRALDGSYDTGFGIHVIQNVRWLFLWTIGWPEASKDYFLSFMKISDEWVKTFPLMTGITVLTNAIVVGSIVFRIIQNKRSFLGVMAGVGWFVLAVSPVLLFRSHISPHYAMIGSLGLYVLIISSFRHLHPSFRLLFLTLWLVQSLAVFRVNFITHWWVQHAGLAGELLVQAKDRYDVVPENKVLTLFSPNPQRAQMVLSEDHALQLIYNDPEVKTRFVTKR